MVALTIIPQLVYDGEVSRCAAGPELLVALTRRSRTQALRFTFYFVDNTSGLDKAQSFLIVYNRKRDTFRDEICTVGEAEFVKLKLVKVKFEVISNDAVVRLQINTIAKAYDPFISDSKQRCWFLLLLSRNFPNERLPTTDPLTDKYGESTEKRPRRNDEDS